MREPARESRESAGARDNVRDERRPQRAIQFLLRRTLPFSEQSPAEARARRLLAHPFELSARRAIIEPFVATEQHRRKRAAERQRIAPVIRGDKSIVSPQRDGPRQVRARDAELHVWLEVGEADASEQPRGVAAAELLLDQRASGHSFDAIESRELQSPRKGRRYRADGDRRLRA